LNWQAASTGQNAGASVSGGIILEQAFETGPFNGSANTAVYIPNGTAAGAFDHATFLDQVVSMDIPFGNTYGAVANQTATGASMWTVPAGFKRDITAQARNLLVNNFGFGFQEPCTGGYLVETNCTFSMDNGNQFSSNFYGVDVSGNNTSGSGQVNTSTVDNYGTDVLEFATLSESYFNLNAHSPESGGSVAGVLMNCGNINGSFSIGGYVGLSSLYGNYPGCATQDGNFMLATNGGMMFLAPADTSPHGAPVIGAGGLVGAWKTESPDSTQCSILGGSGIGQLQLGFGLSVGCSNSGTDFGYLWNTTLNSWDFNEGIGSPTTFERYVASTFTGN
jgi:hypothetical protein